MGSWQIARGRARAAAAAVEQSAQLPPVPAPVSLDEATDMMDRLLDLNDRLHTELINVRAERDGLIAALDRLRPVPARPTLQDERLCKDCRQPFRPRGVKGERCDSCKVLKRNAYRAAGLRLYRQKDAREAKRLGISLRELTQRRQQEKAVARRFPKTVPA